MVGVAGPVVVGDVLTVVAAVVVLVVVGGGATVLVVGAGVVVLVVVVVGSVPDAVTGGIVGFDEVPASPPHAARPLNRRTGRIRRTAVCRCGRSPGSLISMFYTDVREASRRSARRLATFSLLAMRFMSRSRASSPT